MSHIDSVGKIKFGSKISMKTFFENFFYVHWMNAHIFCVIQRLWKTSKFVFQSVISTWKESPRYENSSKDIWKMKNWSQKLQWFYVIKISLIIYCNVNTFRIIHNTSKTFVFVPKSVNDTSRSVHELHGSLKTHDIVKFS